MQKLYKATTKYLNTVLAVAAIVMGLTFSSVTPALADQSSNQTTVKNERCQVVTVYGIYGGTQTNCTTTFKKTGFISNDLLSLSVGAFGLGVVGIGANSYLKNKLQ